jgi:hypothetical protein
MVRIRRRCAVWRGLTSSRMIQEKPSRTASSGVGGCVVELCCKSVVREGVRESRTLGNTCLCQPTRLCNQKHIYYAAYILNHKYSPALSLHIAGTSPVDPGDTALSQSETRTPRQGSPVARISSALCAHQPAGISFPDGPVAAVRRRARAWPGSRSGIQMLGASRAPLEAAQGRAADVWPNCPPPFGPSMVASYHRSWLPNNMKEGSPGVSFQVR